MTSTILVCTVGGSHQPILTAIREADPEFVSFVCSEDDAGTGRRGSYTQIQGRGNIIKAHREDEHPTLPNIPTQAGLEAARFETICIGTDDLDGAFTVLHGNLRDLRSRFAESRIVADYTGGTKTMTAALALAALETGGIDIQVVTGNRSNLVGVTDGTEHVAIPGVEVIRVRRAMAHSLAAWVRYAYDESESLLRNIDPPRNSDWRTRLDRARDLSAAFAAWDRFDHARARRLLNPYGAVVGDDLGMHLAALKILSGEDSPKRTGLQIWDLWLNAERRAAAGRYDDAVGRTYRVIEATAQWVLATRAGINTADLPPEKAGDLVSPGRDGKYQAGLYAAWGLVARYTGSTAAQFFAAEKNGLRNLLVERNNSILAHGFEPVSGDQWQTMHAWVEEKFLPMLQAELKACGVGTPFRQLPSAYRWF